MGATEGCLERLGTDVIDLMLVHHRDFVTPIEETIRALEQLKSDDGKISYYGVSNFDAGMMEECQQHGSIATNQLPYYMFDRRVEREILPWWEANDVGFMSYGTLGFGLLTGAFTEDTTFADHDWRVSADAFGLPLFEPRAVPRRAAGGSAAGRDRRIFEEEGIPTYVGTPIRVRASDIFYEKETDG